MPSSPERQLQVAVLAVERGLATADQVLAAIARWAADSSMTLPEWLEKAGVLKPDARAHLEAEAAAALLGDDTLVSAPKGAPVDSARVTNVTPESLDRYEFKGEHGKGGQAKIYVALDRHLGREVAWKEMSKEAARETGSEGASSLDRFLREARVTGQLEHPSIVPVYELGRRASGAVYYTMRLVRGRTLATAFRTASDLDERLRLLGHLRDVCHALAFAHSRGVIHRDVKPANVMVGEFGETVVLDWGIAKIRGSDDLRTAELARRMRELQDASGETQVGDALGTPAYMSPEQAEGRVEEVDERSDVWGLGALLYELLTGRPPFLGENARATLSLVSASPLQRVREAEPRAPPELAAIAEKALSKRKDGRYQGAGELADDLTAYMSGLRVGAYAYSPRELLWRFAVRHKALLGSGLAVFVAVLVALVVTSLALRKESAAREREQTARAGESVERRNARFQLAQAYAREAERLTDERYGLAARLYAAASLQQNPAHPASLDFDPGFAARTPEAAWLRVDALSLLFQARSQRFERLLKAFPLEEAAMRVAFSADGKLLAATDYGGTLTVWSAEDFSQRLKVRAAKSVRGLAFTPDSTQVVTGGDDQLVKVWDLGSSAPVRMLERAEAPIQALTIDAAGARLATGDQAGNVVVWDLATGAATRLAPPHSEQVRGLAFTPDGTALVSASWDKTARIWDLARREVRATLQGHTDGLYGASISPDGTRLATAAYDRTLRLWDLATGKPLATVDNRAEAYAVRFSPDGALLASADTAGAVRLFATATTQPDAAVRAHGNAGANDLAFHPSGRMLASAGMDRVVRVWALAASGGAPRLPHDDWVYGVTYTPDGRYLATTGWDRQIRIWDAKSRTRVRTLTGHEAGVMYLAASRDGKHLASASYDSTARLWSLESFAPELVLKSDRGILRSSVFSPDGRLLAAGAVNSAALVWSLPSGARAAVLEHDSGVYGCAFSPDGKVLATASGDRAVRLWDVATWKLLARLEGHTDWASGVAWSPDGSLLASSGKDGRVLLWDPAHRTLVARIEGHQNWVDDVQFSPDGRYLSSSGEDERVIVWDVATRAPLLRLRSSRDSIRSAFSPDGKELAVADHLATVVYPLDLPWTVANPASLLQSTQEAAGLRLDGFSTSIAPPQ